LEIAIVGILTSDIKSSFEDQVRNLSKDGTELIVKLLARGEEKDNKTLYKIAKHCTTFFANPAGFL